MARVRLTPKGMRWFRRGHPWIYRDDLAGADAESGEIVRMESPDGRFIGLGAYGDRSRIAVRILTRSDEPVDRGFWRRRIEGSLEARAGLAERTDAYRVISSDADGIPGFIADRYGDVLVVQSTIPLMDRLQAELVEGLVDLLRPRCVIERNDVQVRSLEGLRLRKTILLGEMPDGVWVHEIGPDGRVDLLVDPWEGQKTGAFLDQRENRWAAARLARGRVLDGFCYTGVFSIHAARRSDVVLAFDTSARALDIGRRNAERNGISGIEFREANAFQILKALAREGERFDLVFLDPPAFARSRSDAPQALAGYREVNRWAMRILSDGGTLVTSSCSYNVTEEQFIDVLAQAAANTGVRLRILERRGQAGDHPVLLGCPESAYLKSIFLQR